MRWTQRIVIGIMVLGLAGLAGLAVANEDLKEHPGYVNLNTEEVLGGVDVEPSVEVFLERPLLRMLVGAAADTNPEIAEFISQLDLIQVRVYEDLDKEGVEVLSKVADVVSELKESGWSTVVRVPEEDETVDVILKSDGDLIAGLAVFVAESDEWVFVNILGMIEPEMFGRLLAKLGPGVLEGDIDLEDLGAALGFHSPDTYHSDMREHEIEEIEIFPHEIELSREQLESLVGIYMIQSGEEAGNNIHIELSDDDELFGYLDGEAEARMHPISETTFVVPSIEAAVEFKKNDDGEFTTVNVKVDGETIIANRE